MLVDLKNKRCARSGCVKLPNIDVEGSKLAKFCLRHKKYGMVNIVNMICMHPPRAVAQASIPQL